MNKPQKRQPGPENHPENHLEREKLLLRYTLALEEGDFDTVAAILQVAEQDAELEQMILEINDLEAAEIEEVAHQEDAAIVRELVQTHFFSSLPESAQEPPPLTVGNVIARIHADAAALRVRVERDALVATHHHQSTDTPLPTDLSLRGVSQLLEQLGLKVSRRFQDLFRETALFLRMGRNQGMARLAATRRQQQSRNKPYAEFNNKPPQSVLRENPSDKYEPGENKAAQDQPRNHEDNPEDREDNEESK